jgi:uncharacterized protein YjbI with pentapeptide repeats
MAGAERKADEGCPVEMLAGRCGRPIHHAPVADETPVCLMHSDDPKKSEKAFQQEFEQILNVGMGRADFTGFVFVNSPYHQHEFAAQCCFRNARFTQDADFGSARFTQVADFSRATFRQRAYFGGATFAEPADFQRATFTEDADFGYATFMRNADFGLAMFTQAADFSGARFAEDAKFFGATFTQAAHFTNATFTQEANFLGARFTQKAYFHSTTFTRKANFAGTRFMQETLFEFARFMEVAYFWRTTFERIARFDYALIAEAVEFKDTEFQKDDNLEPGPTFVETKFRRPEEVTFYNTRLEQALLHRCDVSRVNFSNVFWRRRPNGKRMVFDEVVDLKHGAAWDLRAVEGDPDRRNYRLIAELYQQLKKNYDDRRDYWTAGDFHYGEMEMKRLALAPAGRILRRVGSIIGASRLDASRRWLHQKLGLVAFYKYASAYGESYVRPALCLLLVLLVSAALYPVAGLRYDVTRDRAAVVAPGRPAAHLLTYWHPLWGSGDKRPWPRLALWGNSLMSTLNVAIFRKDLTYEPRYPWGDVLALAEQILTSTLVALFLLAVRRQFKR